MYGISDRSSDDVLTKSYFIVVVTTMLVHMLSPHIYELPSKKFNSSIYVVYDLNSSNRMLLCRTKSSRAHLESYKSNCD
jgi:hypothetical protein